MSLPTPTYTHMKDEDFLQVYEPAEDTFLMIDSLEADYSFIKSRRPCICLEVGPGSGVVLTFLASIVGPSSYYLAVDINPHATLCTKKTGEENGVHIETVVDDMLSSMKTKLSNKVDLIVFNPPYVVTDSAEVGGNSISASWAGGPRGREVIDRFIDLATSLLSSDGVLYLLLLEENDPEEVIELLGRDLFESRVILRRKTGPERLVVIRFIRKSL